MAEHSGIAWTEATWNPITGCTKVSAGCKFCYAEVMAKRLQKMGSKRYVNGFRLTLHPDILNLPLKWKTPKKIFVNSMSDLWHKDVPDDFIAKIFDVMVKADHHIFQILTKRPERALAMSGRLPWPKNVWMGTSVEDGRVLGRIDLLRQIPSAIRFLSCEPLIGSLSSMNLEGIDWVIVGGESGPNHRPIKPEWVHEIHELCKDGEIAFFFKQWGGLTPKSGGRELDGRTWDEMPIVNGHLRLGN